MQSPTTSFSHRTSDNLLPSDIVDTTFWHALTAPYVPLSSQSKFELALDDEDAPSLDDFIDRSRQLEYSDIGMDVTEYPVPRHSSRHLSAELNTPLWKPGKKWAWISGKIPEKTTDHLLLKERRRYSLYLTTCEIDNKALTYMSKCWPISPHSKSVNKEIQLYKSGLKTLQGVVVPNLIQIFVRPGVLNVAFDLPHDIFWIEASADMPVVLKKRCIEAFRSLHAHGILHGAVDFSSILVGGDGTVYICDFESSRVINARNGIEAAQELEKVKHMLYSPQDHGVSPHPKRFVVPGTSPKELELAIHKFLQALTAPETKTTGAGTDPRRSPPPSVKGRQKLNEQLPLHGYSLRKRKISITSSDLKPPKRARPLQESPTRTKCPGPSPQKRRRMAEATEGIALRPLRRDEFRGDGIIHDSILCNNLNARLPIIKVRDFGLDGIMSHPMHGFNGNPWDVHATRRSALSSRKRAREDDASSVGSSSRYDARDDGSTVKRQKRSDQTAGIRAGDVRLPTLLAFQNMGSKRAGARRGRGTEIKAALEGDNKISAIDTSDRGSKVRNGRTSWWKIGKPIVELIVGTSSTAGGSDVARGDTSRATSARTVENRQGQDQGQDSWLDRIWRLVS